MSPEKQRIKIAEACGWKHNTGESPSYGGTYRQAGWTSPEGYFVMTTWHEITSSGLPDYLNDLNAMHEAEKVIANKCKINDYWFFLRQILEFPDAEGDWNEVFYFDAINATTAQRAEAFLKTLGLWEDGE